MSPGSIEIFKVDVPNKAMLSNTIKIKFKKKNMTKGTLEIDKVIFKNVTSGMEKSFCGNRPQKLTNEWSEMKTDLC